LRRQGERERSCGACAPLFYSSTRRGPGINSPLHPEGDPPLSAAEVAQNLFIQCLALPVVVVCLLGHKLWFRTSYVSLEQMDIDT
jgi:hypothetical protein